MNSETNTLARPSFWAWARGLLVHLLNFLGKDFRLPAYLSIPWFLVTTITGFFACIMTREPLNGAKWLTCCMLVVIGMGYEYRELKNLGLTALALPVIVATIALAGIYFSFWLFHYGITHAWWFFLVEVALLVTYRKRLRGDFYKSSFILGVAYCAVAGVGLLDFMATPKIDCKANPTDVQYIATSCGGGNWANWHEALPNAPKRPDAAMRDADTTDEGNVISVGGWVDHNDTPAPIILFEGETRKQVTWAESPVAITCKEGLGLCVVASSMTDSVIVINSKTLEVLRAYKFDSHSPSEMDLDQHGKIMLILGPSRGSNKSPVPDLDPAKITLVRVGTSEKYVKAVFNPDASSFESLEGLTGNTKTNSGGELFYNKTLPNGEVLFGQNLRVSSQGRIEAVNPSLFWRFWTGGITAGAAVAIDKVHAERTTVFVNYPFGGIAEYDADLKFRRFLTHRDGGRSLAYDPDREVLFSGFYDEGILIAYDAKTGEELKRFSIGGGVRHMKFNSSRDELLTISEVGGVVRFPMSKLMPEATVIASTAP